MDEAAETDDRQYISGQKKARKWAKIFCLWTRSQRGQLGIVLYLVRRRRLVADLPPNTMAFGGIITCISILCFYSVIFPAALPSASASSHDSYGGHHSRRYAAYDYDLTTPQFTPDGRLLQVEYATKACAREDSNPIVSVGFSEPGGSDTVLIMAAISQPSPPPTSLSIILQPNQSRRDMDEQLEQQDEAEVNSFVKRGHQRAQFRIIEVPLSVYYSSSHRQTTTSTILVGLSGLLSDATALLHTIYSHLEEEQRKLGWHRLGSSPVGILTVDENSSSPASQLSMSKTCQPIFTQPSETVIRLSRTISDKCQKHAFGGGLRPLGASLLLAGVDTFPNRLQGSNDNRMSHGQRVAMCETHPNGGWRKSVYSARHDMSNASPGVMVTGGSINSQNRLKRLIRNRLVEGLRGFDAHPNDNATHIYKPDQGDALYLRQVLRTVISSLVDEWKNRGDRSISSATHDASGQPAVSTPLPQMEVVISSSQRGTIRLTDNDITRLMKIGMETNNM